MVLWSLAASLLLLEEGFCSLFPAIAAYYGWKTGVRGAPANIRLHKYPYAYYTYGANVRTLVHIIDTNMIFFIENKKKMYFTSQE